MPIGIKKKMDQIDAIEQMDNEKVAHAVTDILCELSRAERFHPEWPGDIEDQLEIIADQFEKACRETIGIQGPTPVLKHKLHCVAAMCIRCLKIWVKHDEVGSRPHDGKGYG